MGLFYSLWNGIYSISPSLIMLGVYFLFQFWSERNNPYDESLGPPNITSTREWCLLIEDKDLVVVCEFYATWCSPCKKAAPLYASLASDKIYKRKRIIFRKCNVDNAASIAVLCGIKQMPTFKVFKGGKEVGALLGWDEDELKETINKALKL